MNGKNWLMWIAGGVVALGALALLVLNMIVQSDSVRGRLSDALEGALGMPVEVGRLNFTPWSGLQVKEITADGSAQGIAYSLEEIKATVKFFSIFSDTIVIREIELTAPAVRISPVEERVEVVPETTAEPVVAATTPMPEPTPAVALAEPVVGTEATPKPIKADKPGKERSVEVGRLSISRGSFELVGENGELIVVARDISITSDQLTGLDSLAGQLRIGYVELWQAAEIRDIKSPVTYENEVLHLPALVGHVGDGLLQGSLLADNGNAALPFEAALEFVAVELRELMPEATGIGDRIEGSVSGKVELAGEFEEISTYNGTASLRIDDGRLNQYPILQTLGQALKVDELDQLDLEEATLEAHIVNGVTTVDQLTLRSQNLRLETIGTVDQETNLDLPSTLFIDESIARRLPGFVRESMIEEDGFARIDFMIDGTLASPRSDLMTKLVGGGLENTINKIFRSLRGR